MTTPMIAPSSTPFAAGQTVGLTRAAGGRGHAAFRGTVQYTTPGKVWVVWAATDGAAKGTAKDPFGYHHDEVVRLPD